MPHIAASSRMRIFCFSIILLGILFPNCLTAQPQEQAQTLAQERTQIPLVRKVRGWRLEFLKNATVRSRTEYTFGTGEAQRVFISLAYSFRPQMLTFPFIELRKANGSDTAVIDELPFFPESIAGVEYRGHTSAYMMSGRLLAKPDIHSAGVAHANVVLYDMDGTGVFDTVKLFSGAGLPFVPDWVK